MHLQKKKQQKKVHKSTFSMLIWSRSRFENGMKHIWIWEWKQTMMATQTQTGEEKTTQKYDGKHVIFVKGLHFFSFFLIFSGNKRLLVWFVPGSCTLFFWNFQGKICGINYFLLSFFQSFLRVSDLGFVTGRQKVDGYYGFIMSWSVIVFILTEEEFRVWH